MYDQELTREVIQIAQVSHGDSVICRLLPTNNKSFLRALSASAVI